MGKKGQYQPRSGGSHVAPGLCDCSLSVQVFSYPSKQPEMVWPISSGVSTMEMQPDSGPAQSQASPGSYGRSLLFLSFLCMPLAELPMWG